MKNPNRPANANTNLEKVKKYMLKVNDYVTAENVCIALDYDLVSKLASIKSRLRDLKLNMFGGFCKQTRWVNGVMEYKITEYTPEQQDLFEQYNQHMEDYTHPDNR